MSYILDALKKAESERERGLVPGLHAQPMSGAQASLASQQIFKPVFVVAALGLLALLVVLGFWWRAKAGEPSSPASAVVAMQAPVSTTPLSPSMPNVAANSAAVAGVPPAASPEAAATTVTPTGTAQPALPAAPQQGSVMAPAQITPLPAQPSAARQTAVPVTPKSPDKPVTTVKPDKPAPKPERSNPPPVAVLARPEPQAADTPVKNPGETRVSPATPAQNQLPVSKLSELPADVRLALPKLVISGSTYSDTPAYRMVIINGQVFHEGEKIAADMVLQQIKPNAMVLDYKGQRYSMPY